VKDVLSNKKIDEKLFSSLNNEELLNDRKYHRKHRSTIQYEQIYEDLNRDR
jgi:hypothetical protein